MVSFRLPISNWVVRLVIIVKIFNHCIPILSPHGRTRPVVIILPPKACLVDPCCVIITAWYGMQHIYSFVQLAYAKLTIFHYDPLMCDQVRPPVVLQFRDTDQGPWGMRRIAWSTRIGSRQMPFQRSANSSGSRASSWILIRISMFASTLYIIFFLILQSCCV